MPQEDISAIRSLVGKLNWLSCISRPDISFDTCNISTKVNNMKIRDVIELNKVVKRARMKRARSSSQLLMQRQLSLPCILMPALTTYRMTVVREVI